MLSSQVHTSYDDGVGTVVMADVEEHNVLSRRLVDQVIAAHDDLVAAGARVAVLAADGPTWCGGGDFKAKRVPGQPPAALELFDKLNTSPLVWIAAIGAPALGVGIHLASTCLRVLISEDAWMSVPGWRDGRFPGPLTAELGQIIGVRHALRLAMTEERVTADECVRIGLADADVPADDLTSVATAQARDLAAVEPQLLAAARASWSARLGRQ